MTEKTQAAKKLLELSGSALDAASLFAGMAQIGLLEEREYLSSSGSGEIKRYKALTEEGLRYGKNMPTMSPTKTEVKLYPSAFPDLLQRVCQGLLAHAESLQVTP